ncbi:TIGR03545 family protein [Spirochaetia bacterium]|nr:TIGR03545 family protein [Spirochaetia bacterium]
MATDKKVKAEKLVKPPKQFKKPIPPKKLEKKYLKFLENPADKEFFKSCFNLEGENAVFKHELGSGDIKKLKALLKAIKENRKLAIKIVPLTVAALVAAAFFVFFTMFMNPLLERALESGLEALFEARTEVDNFKLDLLKFRVGIRSITVANRDEPMKNLFQIGRMEFRMKPQAVLRGKIYIEEIRTDGLLFNTDRKTSGALPARPSKVKPPKPPKEPMPPMVDLQNFDAMGLLNREFDKLNTPKAYDTAVAFYNDTYGKYKGEVELVQTRTTELQSRGQQLIANAQSLSSIDYRNPQEILRVRDFITEITTMTDTVQAMANEANGLVTGIQTDIKSAEALVKTAQNSITDDLNHLKSYLDLGSGSAFAALEPSIREILTDTSEKYLDYGLRALEILEKLKASQETKAKSEPKPPKVKKVVFKGRDVIFPTRSYPKFYLGIFATDFTLNEWRYAVDLRGVSSNPDLSGAPVSLALSLDEVNASLSREARFKGQADFRTAAAERFAAEVSGAGFPVSLGDQLSQAGINGFKGDAVFSVGLSGRTDGDVAGNGNMSINKAQLVDPRGTLAQAVDTAVREVGEIRLGAQYKHHVAGKDEFSISTNIGDLIKNALEKIVRAYAQQAAAELERALREKIASYIDGRFVSQEELDLLFQVVKGDKAAMDKLKTTLDGRKNEFEQKIRGAADQAVQQVKEEAKQQAEQAVKDVLQGQTPSAPSLPNLPSLPGLPGFPRR